MTYDPACECMRGPYHQFSVNMKAADVGKDCPCSCHTLAWCPACGQPV